MDEKTYNSFDPERLENYEYEAEYIIKKLKEDAKFRKRFLYGTDPKKCNMARLRAKIIKDIYENYNVIVSPNTFNEIVYLVLWASGTWKVLDTYRKQCTFFSWLRIVAKNAVLERLEDERIITTRRRRTVGNTRLTMLSRPESECQLVIDELMTGTKHYFLLTAIYVDRLSPEEIMSQFGMGQDEYEAAKKEADNKLKDALLRSNHYLVSDVLHDKSKHIVTVSLEFVADVAEWCKAKTSVNPLSDVFGTNLSDEEVRQKTVEFLYDFSSKLEWSDEDRFIWQKRFIENRPPVEVAKQVGRTRYWLDTRYSRVNKRFKSAIKVWWNTHVL